MTLDFTNCDPDFARLMQGEVKLTDFTTERAQELRVYAQEQYQIDLDIANIAEPSTRAMIEKWNRYFP